MSIRTKIAAAAGAIALIALVPTAAEAAPVAYAVQANHDGYNVSCRAGATSGTASIKLRVTRNTAGVNQPTLGTTEAPTTKWVATWPGGTGSITMTKTGTFYSASKDATFPCPTDRNGSGMFTITVQSFNGTVANGDTAQITITVRRVGSLSGLPNAAISGLITTVLGIRFDAPADGEAVAPANANGPTPVGGVRTGAGGTSDGGNNLLLPLGAGLGFAGLAAAVMIRRRRCPAV